MTQRFEAPLDCDLAKEVFSFWRRTFEGEEPDIPLEALVGEEADHNEFICYLDRDGAALTGSCGIVVSRSLSFLAGLGEVSTEPEYRGRGIASRLSREALEEFVERGGEVIFLGTGNPDTARIYHRLGWRRIAGTTVWANITSGDSPEEFLVDYFRDPAPVNIVPGDASLRVSMIPLLLSPHDWQVLDGNLAEPMVSTRYASQGSCLGLCRKYHYLVKRDYAEWFAAKTDDGRLVGISTVRVDDANVCWIDGFTHLRFSDSFPALIESAIEWGFLRKADRFATRLSIEDEDKQRMFEALGFRRGPVEGAFSFAGREVATLAMIRH